MVSASSSLAHRAVNHLVGSDHESSPIERRQSRVLLNASISTDSGVDDQIQTPVQLIALYEKAVELAAKNKISAKNAFHFTLVERLPEILDLVAFDDNLDSSYQPHEPNFVKAGAVIDTRYDGTSRSSKSSNGDSSAKIYGYRVDALHTETQKLNGTMQTQEDEEETLPSSNSTETLKKVSQRSKSKSSSSLVTDLSTISLAYEFDFHPLQPSSMCQWPGGVGIDSIYADMVSYTMYPSSDFPLINGFINLNSQVNKEYDDNERILDVAMKTVYDLLPLREVIQEHQEQDHILGKGAVKFSTRMIECLE